MSATRLGIYHSFPGEREGHVRVGAFSLDPSGRARLEVADERARAELEDLERGVGSASLRRRVTPSEGAVFLSALEEELVNSTYWRLADESPDPDR